MGTATAIAFAILGVPYGPILGVITGLGNFIPFFGGPIGYASLVIVCLIETNFKALIGGLIALSIILFVDGNIVNPRLLAETVEVHPLLVVAALIAGGAIGGLAGMLVAVPTAAFLKVQIDRWVDEREASLAEGGSDEED
jgi:predicted PurR-regulated permease PerM